jgi:hypothetical protein
MTTVTTKMTPEEFLKSDPNDHPDFVDHGDEFEHPAPPPLFMPNLVALIRRMGGPDAIPDVMDQHGCLLRNSAPAIPGMHVELKHGAFLVDRWSHRIYADVNRLDPDTFQISGWHPRDRFLEIILHPPTDWTVGAWTCGCVSIMDMFSNSPELDALAMASCDWFIGEIQRAVETYCLIRRDVFIP